MADDTRQELLERELMQDVDIPSPSLKLLEAVDNNSLQKSPALSDDSGRGTQTQGASDDEDAAQGATDEPPLYTIDLALPPSERYVSLATDFKEQMSGLSVLFATLIKDLHPRLPVTPFTLLSRLALRKLYSKEETEEIRGISKVTGVSMYLLVAFNLLLDSFMGCSSGGIRTHNKGGSSSRMLHYRTLDWGMDELRQWTVRLQYVRSPSTEIIARTVTYVGHVGVLTGVRKGLSISLNFRAEHDTSPENRNRDYLKHIAGVLLGRKPSISTVLRACLFSSDSSTNRNMPSFKPKGSHLDTVIDAFGKTRTPACFVILSDGNETAVLEKELNSARVLRSGSFIAVTNSDAQHDKEDGQDAPPFKRLIEDAHLTDQKAMMNFMIEESVDRKRCMTAKWKEACEKYRSGHPGATDADVSVSSDEVIEWMNVFPVTNECTHFSCVMDARSGDLVWCRRRLEPATPPECEDCEDCECEASNDTDPTLTPERTDSGQKPVRRMGS